VDRKILWVGLGSLVIIGVAALVFFLTNAPGFRGTVYDPPVPASEIALKQADGQEYRLSGQSGKIVMLFFGYTNCKDVCPLTMAKLNQVFSQLGGEAKKVQVVFISVNPERDTPQITQQYASRYNSSFLGLSGSVADLQKVWTAYGVYRELGQPDANGNYDVTHSDRVLLIDQNRNLRLSYASDILWQDMLYDIQVLLK
jgi:protein SCO1